MADIRAKWLRFHEIRIDKRKTKIWEIRTLTGDQYLGEIRWHAPWRKYAFYPAPCTLFEPDCLKDLASFLFGQTEARRLEVRKQKLAKAPPEVLVFLPTMAGGQGARHASR